MASNDLLKRYLDAGMAFTAMTQARAEAIIQDLVRSGELQADQAREAASDLLERGRKNTEALLATVRAEVEDQVGALEAATRKELARLEERLEALRREATGGAKRARSAAAPSAKKAGAKKAATRKAGAKKAAAKKTATKRAGAKKAATKKRAGTTKAGAKKTGAKKAATKRSAGR